MPDNTKMNLGIALKKLLKEKPLEKIRIHDLTKLAGINRQSFYYHYADIYALVGDVIRTAIFETVGEHCTMDTWEEGMLAMYQRTLEEKEFVVAVYNAIPKERIQLFLEDVLTTYMIYALKDTAGGQLLSEEDRDIFIRFITYGFTGTYLQWIQTGMRADPSVIISKVSVLTKEGLSSAIIRSITTTQENKEEV